MDIKKDIESAFARANVPLRIRTQSLNRNIVNGARQIVQMDIGRDTKGNETIRMNIPEDGDVRVLGGDPDHRQVVVMVHEPELKFIEQIWNPTTGKMEARTRRTPEGNRRFLVGMDESHLFIAQLTRSCTSVKQAHEGLKPRALPKGRKAKRQKVKRTGEWFLTPAISAEIAEIESHIKSFGTRKKVGIGTGNGRQMRGRPHIVTESVTIGRRDTTFVGRDYRGKIIGRRTTVAEGTEFIRGRIIHPDHKVVKLATWHKVAMNTENRALGANWAD